MFNNIKQKNVKKIGITILIVIIVLLFFKLFKRPQFSFVVEFSDIPAISDKLSIFKIDVHFRGYDVGNVKKIKLSKDQSHIEFYIDINYKGLRIPKNSNIIFKTENIYGTRYVDIDPPEVNSGEYIKNGDILLGSETYERIDEYLIEEFVNGKTGKLIDNLYEISDIVHKNLKNKENKKLLEQSAGDLAIILENLRKISEDPGFAKDVKSTIKHSSGTLESIDEILRKKETRDSINNAPKTFKKTINSLQSLTTSLDKASLLIPDATKNIGVVDEHITNLNSNLGSINEKVPQIPQSLVDSAQSLMTKTECFENEISKLISKKFLFLRLTFANPGKSFRVCTRKHCPKQQKQAQK